VLDKNLHSRTLFIVDEASMLSSEMQESSLFGSGCLLDDLMEYVYNGKACKLILVGDTAQLPPVGLDNSPALVASAMKRYSETIFEQELTDVVRQKESSGILINATRIRQKIDDGDYSVPFLNTSEMKDFCRVSGSDLIDRIGDSYDHFGIDETIIISRSNKRANKFNQGIRNSILWREEELVPGDLLMVVKNNYFWLKEDLEFDFIANGDIMEVVKIYKYQELYGYRFVDCTVRLLDYNVEIDTRLMLDVLNEESAALSPEKNRELFYRILEDYGDLKPRKKQFDHVKSNEFFNAIQVKYAYAITCHKSQGGQWKSVFVDQGYITEERIDLEYMRWLYTAVTRATEQVYLVNFPDFFFGEDGR
jgi:exodeoxyribonuclease-5